MVSSLRPNEKSQQFENGYHGNDPPVPARPARYHRYSQARVSRLTCVLVVINTVLFILGATSLGFSLVGLIRFKLLGYEETFQDVTIVTIAPWVAAVSSTMSVIMVPLYGCYGAVAQRKCCLVLYFLYLLLMLLLDLVMCLWVVTTADKIQVGIEESIRTAVTEYNTDSDKQRALDDLHRNLGCCGSDAGVQDFGRSGPPWSCSYDYIMEGCNVKMVELYDDYRFLAMAVFASLAGILMATMIVVLMLIGAIRKPKRPDRPPNRSQPDINVTDMSVLGPSSQYKTPLSRPSSRLSLSPGGAALGGPGAGHRPSVANTPRASTRSAGVVNLRNENESSVV